MALEIADFISGLDETWPTSIDPFNKGDDHLRLTKHVLKTTFPGTSGNGYNEAILATEADLNNCTNTTGNLQAQITANKADIDANTNALDSGAFVPIGGIIMYSGSYAALPANFKVCTGASGTPDLRNRFIYGANTESQLGDTGGSANAINVSHTHPGSFSGNNMSGHADLASEASNGSDSGVLDRTTHGGNRHSGQSASGGAQRLLFNGTPSGSVTVSSSGSSGTNANLPPYYKLAYIQRVS